jgi:hypothetical protein
MIPHLALKDPYIVELCMEHAGEGAQYETLWLWTKQVLNSGGNDANSFTGNLKAISEQQ